MPPVSLEMSTTPRGAEMMVSPFSSPQFVIGSGAAAGNNTFRSPRPSKASNIRVVTRIRPLLGAEMARGRKISITPIVLTAVPQSQEGEANENKVSPTRNSLLTKFRPSKISSSPFHDEQNVLSSNVNASAASSNGNKTPSSLPPPSKPFHSATKHTKRILSSPTSTSLLASSNASNKQFDFDAVLGMESTQQQVYDISVGDKVTDNIFRGINFTIMAYGQTASGKSHTMQGYNNNSDSKATQSSLVDDTENKRPTNTNSSSEFRLSDHDGIIPRALHDLFQRKMEYKSSGKGTVSMELTYVELYNEEMRDLLLDRDESTFRPLKMLDQGSSNGGVVMEGLTTIPIQSAEQVHDLLDYAAARRATASTNANMQSSRSHAICTLTVTVTPTSGTERTQAKLTLVDLAGSERIKKTGVMGLQQQESITINQDLFALGQVVSALADKSRSTGKGKQAHVPFRNSKLTRLLRESLGGNCFTVLISCVSPADLDMEESINTLRYAEKARSISNSIKRNVDQAILTPAQCTAMTAENMRLKALVIKLQKRVAAEVSRDTAGSLLDHEEAVECSPMSSTSSTNIFRHGSTEDESLSSGDTNHYSRPERKNEAPIWKHFQDLAKITKNVQISKESHREPTSEIELKESKKSKRGDSHLQSLSPERCLSYEMNLCPSSSSLADGLEEEGIEEEIAKQKEETKRLQEENNRLKEEFEKWTSLLTELEDSVRRKEEDLTGVSNELSNKTAALENKDQEMKLLLKLIDDHKSELAILDEQKEKTEIELNCEKARCAELREEAMHYKEFTDKLVGGIHMLNLASPQRSFVGILHSVDRIEKGFFRECEDVEVQDGSDDGLELNFGAFHDTSSRLQSQLRNQESIRNHMDALEKELCLSKKQMGELESEITNLKNEYESLASEKASEKLKSEKRKEIYEKVIKELKVEASKLSEEKDRSRTLEERLHFQNQDYDSMAAQMQQKMSDLHDDCAREKSAKDDFEDQIQALQKKNAELESKLLANEAALEKERSEKNNLKDTVRAHEYKIQEVEGLLKATEAEVEEKSILSITSKKSKNAPAQTQKFTPEDDSDDLEGTQTDPNATADLTKQTDCKHVAKAAEMLQLADKAIETGGKSITSTSCCSSAGTEFRPCQRNEISAESLVALRNPPMNEARSSVSAGGADAVRITNLAVVDQNACSCGTHSFAGNAEYVDFYLPQISVDCTCGKKKPVADAPAAENEDPCALSAILRPWQVEFLADVGITDAKSLVHECTQRGAVLATLLRKWRRAKSLPSIRTKSCGVALHIWSRTCKSVLRSVRLQIAQGLEPKRPDFLELNIGENQTAVSSLGSAPFRN